MIKLIEGINPDIEVLNKLAEYQSEVDSIQNYKDQIAKAKSLFAL